MLPPATNVRPPCGHKGSLRAYTVSLSHWRALDLANRISLDGTTPTPTKNTRLIMEQVIHYCLLRSCANGSNPRGACMTRMARLRGLVTLQFMPYQLTQSNIIRLTHKTKPDAIYKLPLHIQGNQILFESQRPLCLFAKVPVYSFNFRILLECIASELATDSALFLPAKRDIVAQGVILVDPDSSCFQCR